MVVYSHFSVACVSLSVGGRAAQTRQTLGEERFQIRRQPAFQSVLSVNSRDPPANTAGLWVPGTSRRNNNGGGGLKLEPVGQRSGLLHERRSDRSTRRRVQRPAITAGGLDEDSWGGGIAAGLEDEELTAE